MALSSFRAILVPSMVAMGVGCVGQAIPENHRTHVRLAECEGEYAFLPEAQPHGGAPRNLWDVVLRGAERSWFFLPDTSWAKQEGDRIRVRWSDPERAQMEFSLFKDGMLLDRKTLTLVFKDDHWEFPTSVKCPLWLPLIVHVAVLRQRSALWLAEEGNLVSVVQVDGAIFGPFVPFDIDRSPQQSVFKRLEPSAGESTSKVNP